jgi:hypothetical protein
MKAGYFRIARSDVKKIGVGLVVSKCVQKNQRWGPETRQAMADAPATRARQEKATTDRANGSESGYNVLQSWWWQGQSSIDVTPLLGIAVLRG